MSGSKTMRPRHRHVEYESRRDDFRRPEGQRAHRYSHRSENTRERPSERYQREGHLSPLRSPLRKDQDQGQVQRTRHCHDGSRKPYSGWRERNTDPCTELNTNALRNSSDSARQLRFGSDMLNPRMMELGEDKSLNWADMVDEEENRQTRVKEDIERMKRKLECPNSKAKVNDLDWDEATHMRRQKQIDFGKNTTGYKRYQQLIPRGRRLKDFPATPNKFQKCSRRSWDMQIRIWRRQLHFFDPKTMDGASTNTSFERGSEPPSEAGSDDGWDRPYGGRRDRQREGTGGGTDSDSGIALETASLRAGSTSTPAITPGSSQADEYEDNTDLMNQALGMVQSSVAHLEKHTQDEDEDFDLDHPYDSNVWFEVM